MVSGAQVISFFIGIASVGILAGGVWVSCKVSDLFYQVRRLQNKSYDAEVGRSLLQSRISSLEFDMSIQCPSMITDAKDAEPTQCSCGSLKIETPKCAAKTVEDA